LQQPGRQVAAEFGGSLLPLGEGPTIAWLVGIEQEVEGIGGMGEEAVTQLGAGVVRLAVGWGHEGISGSDCSVLPWSSILLATSPRRNYLNAPRTDRVVAAAVRAAI
jgi:hypothetical protein